MDPLSIVGLASSIAQLADAAFKIVKVLDMIKEGGKERRKLCNEITLIWITLRNLETQFAPLRAEEDGDWIKPIDSLAEPNGVFDQLRLTLDEVWEKLTKSDSKRGQMMQTLRWPLDQSYVERLVGRIEHLKTSIIIVEGQASIALAQEMRDNVSSVKEIVDDSKFKRIIEWLSPCNFAQKQENITAAPGTGGWFFNSESFQSWRTGPDRWFWCHGIPGAGKTFLASSTVNELRSTYGSQDALVLVAFCSFDSPDSQSIDNLVASLLKQVVQLRMVLPGQLEELWRKHDALQTRPGLSDICDILSEAMSLSSKTYIIVDALDELAEDSKRTSLLDILQELKGQPKIMVTSRNIGSIANRFGYSVDGNWCDGCKKYNLDVYWHCEDCVQDFDHCSDCRNKGDAGGHVFVKQFASVKIRIAAQPEDIENYVNRRIEIEEDLRQMVERNPKLRFQILDTIVQNAQDMFLLARFHMDALADCLTVGEVQNALKHLPQEISQTYDQALARIGKLSANRQRAVKRLLLWVSYAERPLTLKELEHATATFRGVREINAGHILSAKVLTSLSAGLVIIDENERVRLTHKTAEDYFSETRTTLFPDGDLEIAECCLAYLQMRDFESGPCTGPDESDAFNARLSMYPLLGYAAAYWGLHARRYGNADIITPQALMLLRNEQLLETLVQALWYTDLKTEDSWDVIGGVDALHLAAYAGLDRIVQSLLAEGADPNAHDPRRTTALAYACSKGYADVVNTLLNAGADASVVDDRGSTPLHRSVKMEHQEVVRRLLSEKDIAVNSFNSSLANYTALLIACRASNADLVKILLTRSDIDVNLASPTSRWNPLLLAASNDEAECLEILLQHPNIDKNYPDVSGHTPVHYAALNGSIESLNLLLKRGADPNLQDDYGGRPLQRAIDYDEYDAVEILLKHKVEWNFTDMLGRTIFHAAAINGRARILRLLLETCKDVDIDAQGNNGETALHDAARCGYFDTTKVLLEFGARTDIHNKGGRTPVRAAKDAGKSNVLEILKEAREKEIAQEMKHDSHYVRKADTFATNTEQPLSMVVEQGDVEALRARLQRVDPEELNTYSPDSKDTPLHIACKSDGIEIINLLLEAGAFVDPVDAFLRTPLTLACQIGVPDIVRTLVKYGADVNMSKFNGSAPWEVALKKGGTKAAVFLLALPATIIDPKSDQLGRALDWAAAWGDLEACKRLVDAGASVLRKNPNGMTPIQVAKSWEKDEVEKYLFGIAAVQKSSSSSPRLPTIDTLKETEETRHEDEDDIGHPPRRSPTSKKETLELAMPEPGSIQVQAPRMDSHENEKLSRSVMSVSLAIMLGLVAILLSFVIMPFSAS